MLQIEEALKKILGQVPRMRAESVPLSELNGRVLAEAISSDIDLPVADNSSVDGYALQAADIEAAGRGHPVSLRLQGILPAGQPPVDPVESGACVRLFTGSFLPKGADAVIMQEETEKTDASEIRCLNRVQPWENVRFKGEDVRKGVLLFESGSRLHTRHLGVLAATGRAAAKVARRPQLAILATGRELQAPGENLRPGAIYESNRIVLGEMARTGGAVPKIYPLVEDNLEATRKALQTAAAENDALLTNGGVSVGDYDWVRPAIKALGGRIDFWRVRLRPGKPFLFGEALGKPIFGLPGNPVSAITAFMVFVRPALLQMQGTTDLKAPRRNGRLTEPIANREDRPHFMRVHLNEDQEVSLAGLQDSHALHGLSKANGWLRVEPGQTLSAGQTASVMVWDS